MRERGPPLSRKSRANRSAGALHVPRAQPNGHRSSVSTLRGEAAAFSFGSCGGCRGSRPRRAGGPALWPRPHVPKAVQNSRSYCTQFSIILQDENSKRSVFFTKTADRPPIIVPICQIWPIFFVTIVRSDRFLAEIPPLSSSPQDRSLTFPLRRVTLFPGNHTIDTGNVPLSIDSTIDRQGNTRL